MAYAENTPNANQEFCRGCGRIISKFACACPCCGAPRCDSPTTVSSKSRLAALLLCYFVGMLGVHRFYVGKVGTGLFQLFTLGGLGIWAFVDFILIAVGVFTDSDGRKVVLWDPVARATRPAAA